MVILAIADRPPKSSILDLITRHNVELVCTLGDLDYFSLQELKKVTNIPKIGVYGNHCSGNYFDSLGVRNLHLKTFEHNGMRFGGFEGSIRYKKSAYAKMYTQEEAREMLKDFPSVDVFLAHSPPYGINDEPDSSSHQGFIALREYIKNKNPIYFLHGHTYPTEKNLIEKQGDTTIVYVYEDKIIKV
ncbi:MAG: metallophosphoesterase family protein [Candidatus Spechtbacterales bacterium]|nr:metallophosphoesterase family protein [Candidatus Spechtbacterales bacterium]